MFLFGKKNESPRLKQLRTLLIFETLSERELNTINNLLHERNYLNNEIIFDAGEEAQALYIILSGKILICRQGEPIKGKIGELEPGRLFGELALLDNSPRSTQARATDDTTLVIFFREDFLNLLETHLAIASKISLQLARHIGKRLRETVNTTEGSLE